MSRKRLISGTLAQGLNRFAMIAVQLISVPVLANSWGLTLYGQWLMLSTIPIFLSSSDLGFANVSANRLIGEVARGDLDEALRTFQSGLAAVLVLCASLFAIVLAVVLLLPSDVLAVEGGLSANEARVALVMLCAGGIISVNRGLFGGVSHAAGHFAAASLHTTAIFVLEGLAVMSVALLGKGPVIAALAYLSVRSLATITQTLLARYHAKWLVVGFRELQMEQIKQLVRPSLAATLYPLSNAAFLQGTAIAVGIAGGAAMVPVYSSLRTLTRTGQQLLQTISIPVMPEYTMASAKGEDERCRSLSGMVATVCLVGGLAFGIALAVLGESILELWTKGAVSAPWEAIALCALSAVFGSIWMPLVNLLLAVNRHEAFTLCFAVSSALAVAFSYFLVERIGLVGGILAYLSVDVSMVGALLVIMQRQGRLPRIGLRYVFAVFGKYSARD